LSAQPSEAATALQLAVTPGWEARLDPLIGAVAEELTIEIDSDWQDANAASDTEQRVVDAVVAGELDLGFVGTRAFTELGVTSLDALTAPFLVDSYDLQQAVLDSDVPERMLSGLEELDVTGLAVAAGSLRRPLGVDGALLSPEDFAGITFHTWRSVNNAATAESLGAIHTDVFGPERDAGIDDGTIDATENTFEWWYSNGRTAYTTVNAALWPATAVLIANRDALEGLTDAQLTALQSASAESFATADDLADADAVLIEQLCHVGKRFVAASADDLAALRRAVQPVYDRLAEDPVTVGYLEEIEALKSSASPDAFALSDDCTTATETTVAATTSPLDGVWTTSLTLDELSNSPLLYDEGEVNDQNWGDFTFTFDQGRFIDAQQNPVATWSGSGTFSVEDDVLTLRRDNGEQFVMRWHLNGDTLVLERDDSLGVTPTSWVISPWTRSS
jgi:TRAP-type C4-dicarboxylate transport system substrate-binding protein